MKLTKPHHQAHNFGAHLHYGIVEEIDPKAYKVRCKIPLLDDLLTFWLPVLTLCAAENKYYHLPKKGAMVLLLLDSKGEEGAVLGELYNQEDKPSTDDPAIHQLKFKNGTTITHNEDNGELTVEAEGDVTVKTKGNVTVEAEGTASVQASEVALKGETQVVGNLRVIGNINATGAITPYS